MNAILKPVGWLYEEFGLASVNNTGRDAWFVILARTCRMFAFGGVSLIIALYFSSLEFTDFQIGLFMTLTLGGDVLLSVLLTLIADRLGRRRVLFAGGALMVFSGVVFVVFENFWLLLLAAVVGVVSATGGDFGPFRAIEESTLSHLTTPKTRSDVLSWYVASSTLGSAVGTELIGRLVELLKSIDGWSDKKAYHTTFWIYILMGLATMILAWSMSEKTEAKEVDPKNTEASEGLLGEEDEDFDESPHGQHSGSKQSPNPSIAKKQSWIAQISKETRVVMYKLWFLLTVDSLADGMVNYSLTNYYMDGKFHLAKSTLGDIMSTSFFLMGISTVLAGPLAKRLGLINTMVFTHLPSSAAVLFFPAPQSVALTVVLLFIRTGLNNMDQAPRAAFIAAVVKPEERTAVMGITSMFRTLASTVGPSITGWLAGDDRFWIAFVVAGALRLAYDVGLWAMFINMKLHTNEPFENAPRDQMNSSDEEEATEMRQLS